MTQVQQEPAQDAPAAGPETDNRRVGSHCASSGAASRTRRSEQDLSISDVAPVQEAPDGPALLERGRHAITGHTDGSWTITRAGPLCETCSACGCGEAADPIHVPAFAVSMIQGGPNALPAPLRAMLGKVMGNGRS